MCQYLPFLLVFIVIYKLNATLQNSIFGVIRTISFPFSLGFLMLFKLLLLFVSFVSWIMGSICVHTLLLLLLLMMMMMMMMMTFSLSPGVRCSQAIKKHYHFFFFCRPHLSGVKWEYFFIIFPRWLILWPLCHLSKDCCCCCCCCWIPTDAWFSCHTLWVLPDFYHHLFVFFWTYYLGCFNIAS